MENTIQQKPLTFEQRLKLMKFHELRTKKIRKAQAKALKNIYNNMRGIIHWLSLPFWIIIKLLIVGFLGAGSFFVIYITNYPLMGIWYAFVVSHCISAALWLLLPNFWEKNN